jgi:3-dehydroquinate synthase
MMEIKVDVPSGQYSILLEQGLMQRAGELIKNITGIDTAVIITDDIVDKLYSTTVECSLELADIKFIKYIFPHGESSKNSNVYISILNFLAENHITRSDAVIALGGGVVGDMAGFVSATYLRGIHLVQIPTTLLAAVDSSVGGKTAIDLDSGKNLAGAFYQPDLVICDYTALNSLPDHVFSDGCAEIIKYGMICDYDLFDSLNIPIKQHIESVISRCVEIKRDIVAKDEKDKSLRQLLNFGHTIGHGIEKCSNYNIPHGTAVAIGMAMITKSAVSLGFCDSLCYDKLCSMLKNYTLPIETEYSGQQLIEGILSDKKRSGEYITLVLPKSIGKCFLHKTPINEISKYLDSAY